MVKRGDFGRVVWGGLVRSRDYGVGWFCRLVVASRRGGGGLGLVRVS